MNRYTLSAAFGIVIGLAAAFVVAGGGNGPIAQRAVVYVTPEPPDWTPRAKVGARIGVQPGGVARGYWEYTVYDDRTVDRRYVNFPFDWTP